MSNLKDLNDSLLRDPSPTADLDQLARELNELANIRQSARLAFCKRLAAAYLLLIGHRPNRRSTDGHKFRDWCDRKIRSSTGKKYSHRTIELYLIVGFSKNPEAMIQARTDDTNRRAHEMRRFGAALTQAVEKEAPKVLSVTQIKSKYRVSGDIAQEVNALMTAWEAASSQARSQFLYLVSGRKVA